MWHTIMNYTILAVVLWTFWQVISLLVWRKNNAPGEKRSLPSDKCYHWHWVPFTGSDADLKKRVDWLWESYHKRAPWHYTPASPTGKTQLDLAAKRDLDALTERHEACVIDLTKKLQAICPHADVTVEETEDYREKLAPARRSYRLFANFHIYAIYGPYGRRTVTTCKACGEVEDKFEEYEDQTPPETGGCS